MEGAGAIYSVTLCDPDLRQSLIREADASHRSAQTSRSRRTSLKHLNWMGWLLAGLLLMQNAAVGLAMPSGDNPLEGRRLQTSSGTSYVYHEGVKFRLEVAEMGDQLIEAIPTASLIQWNALFGSTATVKQLPPPVNPEPFPGYS
jgi:hypothetical protein